MKRSRFRGRPVEPTGLLLLYVQRGNTSQLEGPILSNLQKTTREAMSGIGRGAICSKIERKSRGKVYSRYRRKQMGLRAHFNLAQAGTGSKAKAGRSMKTF